MNDSIIARWQQVANSPPAERARLIQFEPAAAFAADLDLRPFRILRIDPQPASMVLIVLTRVMTATITAAWDGSVCHVDPTGRRMEAHRMPWRLVGIPKSQGPGELVALLSDVRIARRAALLGADGRRIPLGLEAGYTASPKRLWKSRVTLDCGRIIVAGYDRPMVATLDFGAEPWRVFAIEPLLNPQSLKGVES